MSENVSLNLEHSQDLSGVASALAKVQSKIKSIRKDASGYGYKYSSISDIMDYVLPILSENDLALTQFGGGTRELVTMLIHTKTGQFIKGRITLPSAEEMEMKGTNIAQKDGSLRTYFKRYSVCEIIGLTSNDEDNDASSEGFKKNERAAAPAPAPKAKAVEQKVVETSVAAAPKRGGFKTKTLGAKNVSSEL